MKNRVARVLTVAIAMAAVAAVHAEDRTVTANVPFNFYMGSSPMAEGAYRVDEFSHGAVECLRSIKGKTINSVMTYSVTGKKGAEPARLVFHRYGGSYFLAEIWTGDGMIGHALSMTAREKELARSGAAPTLAVIRLALR